jgi:hypothetical protein
MQQRNVALELGLVVASVGVLVHWLDPKPAVLVTALVMVAAAAGTGPLVGEWRPWRWPLIPMALPAVAALSIAGIARLVAPVPWLVLVFVAGWAVVAWLVRLETGPDVLATVHASADAPPASAVSYAAATPDSAPPTVRMRPKRRAEYDLPQIVVEPVVVNTPEMAPHPRPLAVRSAAVALAFLAFVAVGGLVPGGLALDRQALSTTRLAELVALNAAIAGVLGYRLAALTSPYRVDRIIRMVGIGQYAVPVAVAAAALRSLALPRLYVPALLTLVVYVVTVLRESPEPATRDERLLEELAVLGIAGLAIVLWGLLAR